MSGKIARMWEIAAADPELRILHRDQIRVLPGRLLTEGDLTGVIGDMAAALLSRGYGVVTAAQNLAPSDRQMWDEVARETGAALEWVRTG